MCKLHDRSLQSLTFLTGDGDKNAGHHCSTSERWQPARCNCKPHQPKTHNPQNPKTPYYWVRVVNNKDIDGLILKRYCTAIIVYVIQQRHAPWPRYMEQHLTKDNSKCRCDHHQVADTLRRPRIHTWFGRHLCIQTNRSTQKRREARYRSAQEQEEGTHQVEAQAPRGSYPDRRGA